MTIRNMLTLFAGIVFGILEAFLGLRFILKLFGANAGTPFVQWIYDTSAPMLAPFAGIFPTRISDGFIFEFSTLFAMIIYAVIYMLILALVRLITEPAVDAEDVAEHRATHRHSH